MAICLPGLARISQSPHRAVKFLAAAQVALERSGKFINPLYRVEYERAENKLREGFCEQDFSELLEESYTMKIDDAAVLALEEYRV